MYIDNPVGCVAEILEFVLGSATKKQFLEEQEQIRKKAKEAAPAIAGEEAKRVTEENEYKE